MSYPPELFLHCLNTLPGLGLKRLGILAESMSGDTPPGFDSPASAFMALGIEPELAEKIVTHLRSLDIAAERQKLAEAGIQLLSEQSGQYPPLLKEISNRPRLLYVRGTMPHPDDLCVAVVGTRKITGYGRNAIPFLIGPIIEAGAVVISGLAYGVDSAVHQLAVDKQAPTIAVVAGGVDDKSIYPKEHAWLAEQIIKTGGALVSEYPPGTASLNYHFVARNRIISGMSAATVVVECDTKSGSLITAQYALEQNRIVFAVPGPIYSPTSQGPNNLIKMGARPLTEPEDLFEELNLEPHNFLAETPTLAGGSPAENTLLTLLTREPQSVDVLIQLSKLAAGDVMSALTYLEMKGKIRNVGGQQYMLAR